MVDAAIRAVSSGATAVWALLSEASAAIGCEHEEMRWPRVAGAAGAGAVLGVLGRDLPLVLALAILPSADVGPCGMEEAIDCAFDNLFVAFEKVLELALLVLVLCAVLAALGTVAVALGAVRLLRGARRRRSTTADPPPEQQTDWLAPGLIGTGTCLVVPGLWLLGSFLVFLAR